jgi:hypothetical protein
MIQHNPGISQTGIIGQRELALLRETLEQVPALSARFWKDMAIDKNDFPAVAVSPQAVRAVKEILT